MSGRAGLFGGGRRVTEMWLPSSGAAGITPAFDASWNDTSIGARLAGVWAPGVTAMTDVTFTLVSAANLAVLCRQWVSPPLLAQTIPAMTIGSQLRGSETNLLNNLFPRLLVRAFSGDGLTARGTLFGPTNGAVEWTQTATNRTVGGASSAVTVQAGDVLVIEYGHQGTPGATNHNCTWRIGDAAASDLPVDDTTTTDLRPFVSFSTALLAA